MAWAIACGTTKMFNFTLSQRIRYALVIVSTLSALLFSAIAHFLIEDFEDNILKVHLKNDLNHFIQHYKDEHQTIQLHLEDVYFVKYPIHDNAKIDDELKDFVEGEYELIRPYGEDMVFVKDLNHERYILVSKQEHFEHLESISTITLFTATFSILFLSLLVSQLLVKRILRPIRTLTGELKRKHKNELDHQPITLSTQKDEVGFLVDSFNQYLEKISQLLQREQLFTSDISHELRTPLMVIKSSVELLEAKEKDCDPVLLSKINQSIQDIQELIDTFLSMARDKSKNQSNLTHANAKDIVQQRIEFWQNQAQQQNRYIHFHCDTEIHLTVSAPQLSTIVNNLIKNALHHSQNTQIDVYLSNDTLTVMDHGQEMPSKLQDVMYDAYQKANPTSDGLGLGLSIIKRICEHLNWSVQYQFAPEHGSAFIVKFSN